MLAVANDVHPTFRLAFVLCHETGHRLGSVRHLRSPDIDLSAGTVRWRAENDKIGYEHESALSEGAHAILEAARQQQAAIGDAWVLPSGEDTRRPSPRRTLLKWWQAAEVLAELDPVLGRGFHSLRRKFAHELRGAALRDVADLGGWKSPVTVVKVYQQPDTEAQRAVLRARTGQ